MCSQNTDQENEFDTTFVQILKRRSEQKRSGRQRAFTEPKCWAKEITNVDVSPNHNVSNDSGILSNTIGVLFSEVSDESFERMERLCEVDQKRLSNRKSSSSNDTSAPSTPNNSDRFEELDYPTAVHASNLGDSFIGSVRKLTLSEERSAEMLVQLPHYEDCNEMDEDQFNDTLEAVEYFIKKGKELEIKAAKRENRLPKAIIASPSRRRAIIEWANKNLH